MAIADKAFFGIDSIQDLKDLEIPLGSEYLHLRWNASVRDKPVARKATLKDGVTDQPFTECVFDRIFKAVQSLADYFFLATIHALRRALGKVVDGK